MNIYKKNFFGFVLVFFLFFTKKQGRQIIIGAGCDKSYYRPFSRDSINIKITSKSSCFEIRFKILRFGLISSE